MNQPIASMRTTLLSVVRLSPLLFVLLVGATMPAFAQELHTVRIQKGTVFVDGEEVPPEKLPESLRADDVQLHFEFAGKARFHIDGSEYALEDGRIVEVPPGDDDLTVFFGNAPAGFFQVDDGRGMMRTYTLDGASNGPMGTYLQVLDRHADQFEKISAELSRQRIEDPSIVATRLRDEAEQAATMVRAFPRVEVQTYLTQLQDRDHTLYERLLREQRMEVASSELARRVFAARDDESRRSLTEDLREQLEEIFELKQQNRRDEISELEQQLKELREQLAERESNREAIIDRRLKALVGRPIR